MVISHQLASRLEDQLSALKGRGYEQKSVIEQFQKALVLSREDALKKVIKVLKKQKKQANPLSSL